LIDSHRFRPSRYGIVSLYQYAEQVFVAEQGRLALRGRNTSGKSKALELLVPFVLDGDITPRKLDPFASRTKTMRWNLIECTDDYDREPKRIGYVWVEFARTDEHGHEHRLTCGVGLEAVRGAEGLKDRWYFLTPQRIGSGLELCAEVHEGRKPLLKRELAEAVRAGGGQIFDTQADYKEAIRAALLPFPSAALYEQHLEVVRQLRKPKLSDKLDSTALTALLSSTLPAVEDALMRRLGDSLERLQGMQQEAEALNQARAMVADLAGGAFRAYARGVVATRAEALKAAVGGFDRARAAERAAREALREAESQREHAERRVGELVTEHARLQAERETLLASEEYKSIAVLEERTREREEAAERLREREHAAEELRGRLERAEHERSECARRLEQALEQLRVLATRLREHAGAAGFNLGEVTAPHQSGAESHGVDELLSELELRRLEGLLIARQGELDEAQRLQRALRQARDALDALREPLESAQCAVEQTHTRHERAETELETARERGEDALRAWAEQLIELALADADVEAMCELLLAGRDARALLSDLARPRLQEILTEQAALGAREENLGSQLALVQERLRALRAEGDPAPAPRSPRPSVRAGRSGAPLWLVCDFAEHLPEDQRGPLEAALEEAGLLDAWISPDGALHDGDAVLLPEPLAGRTLADLLVPAPGRSGLDAALVDRVLHSLALEGPLSVAPGRFRLGPLHGRHAKTRAEFIGAAAREARRRALIEQAEAEQAALEAQLLALRGAAEQLQAALARLGEEQEALPGAEEVAAALRALARIADQLANAERTRAELLRRRDLADEAVSAARATMAEHARRFALPTEDAALELLGRALGLVRESLPGAERALARYAFELRALNAAQAAQDERAQDAAQASMREQDARAQLQAAEGRLDATRTAQGATAERVRELLDTLRRRLSEIERDRNAAESDRRHAGEAVVGIERDIAAASDDAQRADDARARALDDVRVLGAHELFSAGLGMEAAPGDERQSGAWTLTGALERVRALPAIEERIDLANRRRRVEESVSELAKRLVAFDMDAALRSEGELTLVQMSWHGAGKTLPQMVRELDEDLERRETLMSEERRKVFGDALLAEIAEHLRARVADVRASVRKRNETLRRCKTGAGRWVQLKWQRALESPAERDVLALLEGQSVELLGEDDRRALFEFFQSRIAQARGELLDAAPERSAADYLAQAFDYRAWWSFELSLHEPGREPRRLTSSTQGEGSGGERSVLMHMPLFATAASMYDMVPAAPRIVALDEAMDGIDDLTREQMFAVLVDLDLDLFMTSFDINPCVATVPRIGFYELHRDNAEWGVYGQHFIWDGQQEIEVDD